MPRTISNSDDFINSSHVIARIWELEDELAEAGTIQPEVDEDAAEELATLKALEEEAKGYAPDWTGGILLIRDSYFVKYVQEMLEDCGEIPKNLPDYVCIDWDATARNVRYDYTAVEFGDVTYWIR